MSEIVPTDADIVMVRDSSSDDDPHHLILGDLILCKVDHCLLANTAPSNGRDIVTEILAYLDAVDSRFLHRDTVSSPWNVLGSASSHDIVKNAIKECIKDWDGKKVCSEKKINVGVYPTTATPKISLSITLTNRRSETKNGPAKESSETSSGQIDTEIPGRHPKDDVSLPGSRMVIGNNIGNFDSQRTEVNNNSIIPQTVVQGVSFPPDEAAAPQSSGDSRHEQKASGFDSSSMLIVDSEMIECFCLRESDDEISVPERYNIENDDDFVMSLLEEACMSLMYDDEE